MKKIIIILFYFMNLHSNKIYSQHYENCGFEVVEKSFKPDYYKKAISDQISFMIDIGGIRYDDEYTPFSLMLHFRSYSPIIEDNSHVSIKLENGTVITKSTSISTSVLFGGFVCYGHFTFSAKEVNILREEKITNIEMDILQVKLNNNKSNKLKDTFNCLFPN